MDYRKSVYADLVLSIRDDASLLQDIDFPHIRAKLLTYCINPRFEHFLSTDLFSTQEQSMIEIDNVIQDAIPRHLMHWLGPAWYRRSAA